MIYEKRIEGFEDYSITRDGKVISYKKDRLIMKTWYQKTGYENIKLSKNGQTYHKLIHRLVAEAFIQNPNNLPEVNHINKNPKDNRMENLEWCTRKSNLYDSYSTMSPVRNFSECELWDETGVFYGYFQSVRAAAIFCSKMGGSMSSMIKYYKSKGFYLKKV